MQRRRLASGAHALIPEDLSSRGFLVAFTERGGGVSAQPFASLNLGLKTRDPIANVRENRRRVVDGLGVPAWAMPTQVHGARLVRVGEKRAGAGFSEPGTTIGPADALAVTRPRLPVAVITADCLPIALASPKEGLLVVVHAGWRGLAGGVLSRAIAAFERPGGVLAAIGPAIGPDHYEVGEEVTLAVAAGSPAGAAIERRRGRLYLDLPGTAAKIMRGAGVRRIEDSGLCTACLPRRFFSHRREGETGRQGLIAMRL